MERLIDEQLLFTGRGSVVAATACRQRGGPWGSGRSESQENSRRVGQVKGLVSQALGKIDRDLERKRPRT